MFLSASCSYVLQDYCCRLSGLHMFGSPSKLSTSSSATRPITRSMSSRDDGSVANRPRTLSICSDDFDVPPIGVLSYVDGIEVVIFVIQVHRNFV